MMNSRRWLIIKLFNIVWVDLTRASWWRFLVANFCSNNCILSISIATFWFVWLAIWFASTTFRRSHRWHAMLNFHRQVCNAITSTSAFASNNILPALKLCCWLDVRGRSFRAVGLDGFQPLIVGFLMHF